MDLYRKVRLACAEGISQREVAHLRSSQAQSASSDAARLVPRQRPWDI